MFNAIENGGGSHAEYPIDLGAMSFDAQKEKFIQLGLENYDSRAAELRSNTESKYQALMGELEEGN